MSSYYVKTYDGNIYVIVGFIPNGYLCKPCLQIEEDGNREEIFEVPHSNIALACSNYQKIKAFKPKFEVWQYDWQGIDWEGNKEYAYRSYHITKVEAIKFYQIILQRQRKFPFPYKVEPYSLMPKKVIVNKDTFDKAKQFRSICMSIYNQFIDGI